MLKARLVRVDGGKTLLLGLSALNVERLQQGQPIQFAVELGDGTSLLEGVTHIGILAGETEDQMAAMLEVGLLAGTDG